MVTRSGSISVRDREREGGGGYLMCVCRRGGWVVGNNEFGLHIPIFFLFVLLT